MPLTVSTVFAAAAALRRTARLVSSPFIVKVAPSFTVTFPVALRLLVPWLSAPATVIVPVTVCVRAVPR